MYANTLLTLLVCIEAWVNELACNREYTDILIMVLWKRNCDSDI